MSEEKTFPQPFSVMLADCEAELKQTLQAVQALPSDKTVIASDVETRVKELVDTIKILRKLLAEQWELAPQKNGNYMISETSTDDGVRIINNDGKIVVSQWAIKNNVVGDLLALYPFCEYMSYFGYSSIVYLGVFLPAYNKNVWLQPKHLPLPVSTQKLEKVCLADGNTAWLTPETLKSIRKLIESK